DGKLWCDPTFTFEEVKAIVDEAHRHGKRVACLPPPSFWMSFLEKPLDNQPCLCFTSTGETLSNSQSTRPARPATTRRRRDRAGFAAGPEDLPSSGLPKVPSGRRPPGMGAHGGLPWGADPTVQHSAGTKDA